MNVSTLPMPQSGTFAAHELINNESVTVRFASAFLTEEVFGERVLVIHGNQIAAKLLCTAAKKCGLSYFDGIRADINPKKVSKVTSSSTVLKLNGTLFGILEELSGNIQIKLPDHKTEGVSAAELIPPSVNLARSDTDCVFSARLSPTDSPLPYHSGVYGVLSPLISAASRGVNRKNGEISLSVSASLSFNDEKSIGRSLAFILGLYRAQIELSIPLVGSCIEFTDGTSSEVTISVHGFSESPASLTLPSESVEGFLCGTADGDLLPNFGIIRELIDG